MDLGLCGPQRLQDKLLRVLAVLNSAQLQQPPGQQPGEQQTQSTPSGDAVEDSAAATAAEVSRASPEVPEEAQESAAVQFCLSDVQGAARRDQQWLLLSADTLEQRLLGMQQELQVSRRCSHSQQPHAQHPASDRAITFAGVLQGKPGSFLLRAVLYCVPHNSGVHVGSRCHVPQEPQPFEQEAFHCGQQAGCP